MTSLTNFCIRHQVLLPHKTAEDFRPLPRGTYYHNQLHLGSSREGITNGVVAFLVFGEKLVHCHLKNLNAVLDAPPKPACFFYKKKPKKARLPKSDILSALL